MKRFDGFDYMHVDTLLTEEELLVRSTVRRFVEEEVLPLIKDNYERGTFPEDLIKPMAELGIFGATIQGYGCAGENNVVYGLMMQELERADSGIRSFASVQSCLVMYPIHAFGSDEQKNRWLPRLASAESIGCYGLTEPDYGSDPGGIITTAVRDGDDYVLNGAKMWITNGSLADVAIVWAKSDGIVHGFIVEKDRAGFEARKIPYKLSLRASDTSELIFSDCRIPKDNLLPGTGGLKHPLMCLNQARYGIAWGAMGAAMACFHGALEYSKERIQFNKPIASFQITQKKLADMATEIALGQLLNVQLGRLKDQRKLSFAQVSMAKRNNVRKALEIARTARGILGANGISGEYPVIRHMCNLESVDTYEGTYDVHTLIVGRELTGIDAFA
ncbi:MAG: acyl-CoA dehydrogenase [Candidatus Latescibacteria bacterium]|nr:acyl-CoA dehydrogenase [Candidatus Latescibacterota bacterium]NIM22113.1 acyl-CoA dehydrogenase [Candidatus Latescibacterota bacterium]NIM64663.1 acyl-CoA dehydrogenase [Candidatus Latescibacterota bacterium]NIO01173.1 acyl-CoA dehydrogenase [Candidatus Latescibacterota bacterium]NIO27558.1 acyl-CoA dehydrogenase [Candidatus Latescibacterota bacterium]